MKRRSKKTDLRAEISEERQSRTVGRRNKARSQDYTAAFSRLMQERSIIKKPLATIRVPAAMNLDTEFEEVLKVITKINGDLLYGDNGGLKIDLSGLCQISTEVALLLLSEIDRCMHLCRHKVMRGNYPADTRAASILSEIGYFSFFRVKEPKVEKSERVLLTSTSGNGAQGALADALLTVFEHLIDFSYNSRKKLYDGLVECMTNVQHHAYRHKRLKNRLKGRWWMNGFADPSTGEVTFSFVDQGITIPTSLRENWRDWLRGVYIEDSELIVEAIKTHKSRLGNIRRGNGLPELYEILTYAPSGKFRVMSNNAIVTLYKDGVEERVKTKLRFQGTMISWSLYPKAIPKLENLSE